MSNYEETSLEKQIREYSENKNPYSEQCVNRHLWSEGFRRGAKMTSKDFKGDEILIAQKAWDVVALFEENKMYDAAKMLRNNL